jgi:hypothetical protein
MARDATTFTYARAAFLNHWNLLFLCAGAVGGFIVSMLDIVLPLVGAAEIFYLAAVSTNGRFQKIVDAERGRPGPDEADEKTKELIAYLSAGDRKRFAQLKDNCAQLRNIALAGDPEGENAPEEVVKMQLDGINRMLWIYLKLLYSKNALDNYFQTVGIGEIQQKIDGVQKRIETMGLPEKDSMEESKKRESLSDTLETLQKRLQNYEGSRKNYDFINLELERLAAKIASLSEMGVHRQNPRAILSEIDLAASSIDQMEAVLPDLEFLSDNSFRDWEAPDLLKGAGDSNGRRR